jgi:GAF domain-containing protein
VAQGADRIRDGFMALSSFFVDEGTMGDTLRRVSQLACQALSADMAAITMLVEGKPATGVFTDPEAVEIDRSQYSTGRGPCLDAFRHRQVYRIDSTSEDDRWPEFAATAAAHGVLSTISLPLAARGEGIGALNLYARAPAAFVETDPVLSQGFADQAAILLANAQVYWDARELNENLEQAMRSRAMIDQAIGVIMVASRQTPEEAFQILVRASQRENRKVRDIAAAIVARAQDPDRPGDGRVSTSS